MSKNSNKPAKSGKRDEHMSGAMKFFLAGCVAELYLLVIYRFYINADSDLQRIAWYDSYLWVLLGVGAAVLAAGAVCAYLWRGGRKRAWGLLIGAAGLYMGAVAGLVRWNMSVMTLLMVVVPVVMLLGILWNLYDRECALALTILGASLIALWVFRRGFSSTTVGVYVKIALAIYLVLLIGLLVQVARKKLPKLLSPQADPLPVYVAGGLSLAAMAIAFVSATAGYYAMWVLGLIAFGLAVYYTVKQL